ncbi:hypothetical protein HNQ56_000112 [Anaerotaenia torta]|uniref:hypothetical protein n=1 Tax=Anaerotaenia torta TaxID=433293 RepID=UPI003D2018B1
MKEPIVPPIIIKKEGRFQNNSGFPDVTIPLNINPKFNNSPNNVDMPNTLNKINAPYFYNNV